MRNENLEEMTWDILMSLRKSNAPANYKVVKNAQTELLALFTQQLKSVSECNCPELGGSSEGAAPHPSLNPQADHLNNELNGIKVIGYNGAVLLSEDEDAKQLILNIINQEKAKLVDTLERKLTAHIETNYRESGKRLLSDISRIKQEEGLKP